MVVKHCAYGLCKSDSRHMDRPQMIGVRFFPFPNKKWHREKCIRWANACNRVGFSSDKVTGYTYICSLHFHGEQGPTREHPDPISAPGSFHPLENCNPFQRSPLPTPEGDSLPLQNTDEECRLQEDHKMVVKHCGYVQCKSESRHMDRPQMIEGEQGPTREHPDPISAPGSFHPLENCNTLQRSPLPTPEGDSLPLQNTDEECRLQEATLSPAQPSKRQKTIEVQTGDEDSMDQNVMISCDVSHHSPGESCENTNVFTGEMSNTILLRIVISAMDKGWTVGRKKPTLSFNCHDGAISSKSVLVNYETGSYTIEANGKQLEKFLISSLPQCLDSEKSLMELLDKIHNANYCSGLYTSLEPDLKAVATVPHSPKCSQLVFKKSTRCSSCTQGRKVLMCKMLRHRRVPNKTRATNLPREQLVTLVQTLKYTTTLLQRKLARAVARLEIVRTSGHALCDSCGMIADEVDALSNNDPLRVMLTEQLNASKAGTGHGMRWHPDIVKWAAYIRHKSPAAYKAMSSSGFLRLPSASTLVRLVANSRNGPGIHAPVLNDMARQANLENVPEHL